VLGTGLANALSLVTGRNYSQACLACLAISVGGLVAGIRAGFAYNTFPLMNGYLVPREIMLIRPWYMNFVDNMATVQFDHRLIAWMLFIAVPIWWWRVRAASAVPSRARTAAHWLLAMLLIQITLGISTLLLVVPLRLAVLHQAGAVLLFMAALNAAQALRRQS
jgi:cytochrome c oxidase assembly protein subunit 15